MHQCQFCLRSTHHIDTCDDCREVFTRIGPAPKDEVMEPILDGEPRIDGKLFNARTAERRARFERAYMAALVIAARCDSAQHGPVYPQDAVSFSREVALETVRQWDAMMAELEGEAEG